VRKAMERALFDLEPGVTEIATHPAVDTPELRALTGDWPSRVDDHQLLVADHDIRTMAERAGVTFIGYRELRDLQRA
jgi:chitin disaccharide deacetylase